jgi:uncharacterized protein (DUF1684 family)/histidinol-phosphate/aromatic aminotransferase/cobyric acid decarboxylase-like protein
VPLPARAPASIGRFVSENGRVRFDPVSGTAVTLRGQPVTGALELRDGTEETRDELWIDDIALWLHRSGDRLAIRLRDPQSELATTFAGFTWYPIDPAYRVTARFHRDPAPRDVKVPSLAGDDQVYTTEGTLEFTLHGERLRMRPMTTRPGRLFLVFRDATSGRDTYGVARFLYADLQADDTAVLDFNQAYNPPCAFNPHTTCPLPLPENRLTIPVAAGELDYRGTEEKGKGQRAKGKGQRAKGRVQNPFSQSRRLAAVQAPVIPIVGRWIADTPGTISLGQGIVSYGPPPGVLDALRGFGGVAADHRYGPVEGLAPLVEAIEAKLAAENGITVRPASRVLVTAGGNQAFMNAVLALTDPGDEVILPVPYYFNHEMAVVMAGARPVGVRTGRDYQLDVQAIADAVTPRTRAVVTVSPNNPTGAVYPEGVLGAVNALCRDRGVFHVHDEAYEYFVYGEARHFSPGSIDGAAAHTISLYSLSKAYGMASWRVGYMVVPEALAEAVHKIQDTLLICPPAVSQHARSPRSAPADRTRRPASPDSTACGARSSKRSAAATCRASWRRSVGPSTTWSACMRTSTRWLSPSA